MKQKNKSFRRKRKNNKKGNKKKTKKAIIKGGGRLISSTLRRVRGINPVKAVLATLGVIIPFPFVFVVDIIARGDMSYKGQAYLLLGKVQRKIFRLNVSHRKRIKKFKKKIKEYKKRIKELELKKKNDYSWADSPASKMHETYLNSVRELEQEKNKLEGELEQEKNKLKRENKRGNEYLYMSYYFDLFFDEIDVKYKGDQDYANTINFLIGKIKSFSRAIAVLKFSDEKKRRYFSESPRDKAFNTIDKFIVSRIKTINRKISDSRKNGSENLGEITYNEYLKLLKVLMEKIQDYLSILNNYVNNDGQVDENFTKMLSDYEPDPFQAPRDSDKRYIQLHDIDVKKFERVLDIVNKILSNEEESDNSNEEESDNIKKEFDDKIKSSDFENMYIATKYPPQSIDPIILMATPASPANDNNVVPVSEKKSETKQNSETSTWKKKLKELHGEKLKKELKYELFRLTNLSRWDVENVQLTYGGGNEEKKQYGGNLNSINLKKYTDTLTKLKESNSLPKAINNIKKLMNNNLYRFLSIMYGIPQDISDYEDEKFELPPEYIELIDSNIKIMNDIVNNVNQQESKETVTEGSLNKKIQDLENSQDISSFFTNYYEIMVGIKKLKQNEKVNVGSLITETNIAYMKFIKTKFPEIITQIKGIDREKQEVWDAIISEQKNEDDDVSSEKIAQIFLIDLFKKSELNLSKIRQFFIDCKANPTMDSKQSCRGTLQSLSIDNKIRYNPLNFQQTNSTIFNNDNIIERMKLLANTLFPGVTEIIDDMEISEDNGEQDVKLEPEEEQDVKLEQEQEQDVKLEQEQEQEQEQEEEPEEQQTTGGKKSRKTRKRRKRNKSRKRRKRNKSRKRRKRNKSRKRRKH